VGPWDEMMEPNGFAILTFPRTLGFSCLRAESSFAYARVPLKHGRHARVASRLTAAFASQLLLPTRLAVIVTFDLPPLLPACCPSCISRGNPPP
jgi:hypothetical protein